MRHIMRFIVLGLCSIALVSLLGSCGGGGGGADKAVGVLTAPFLVIDLQNRSLATRNSIPDLLTNPLYKDRYLVLRRVSSGSFTSGSALASFGHHTDEGQAQTGVDEFFLAVFELTQDQWENIAGTSPWVGLPAAARVEAAAIQGDKPAYNLTYDEVITSLIAAGVYGEVTLALPTESEWEYACRAGSAGEFCWGSTRSALAAGAFATIWETAGGSLGPTVVGSRFPNAFGIFDMHGNVWEWAVGGALRGGSWNDSLPMARSANRVMPTLDPDTDHPLVGLRLVARL